MTNDIVINNIINELCQKFNVAASELIPRLQAYNIAMCKFGIVTAGIIGILISAIAILICKHFDDEEDQIVSVGITIIIEIIPIIVIICNVYEYIGWKYAPEIKAIEYISELIH